MKSFTLQLNAAFLALSINATNIGFGEVVVNTSAPQFVTLASSSNEPVSAATLTGTSFSMSGAIFPLAVNPGQSATLDVAFDPTVTGTATGAVTLSTNASSGGTATISLSGTGTAPPQVAVTVTPSSGSLTLGTSQQFTATVTGTANNAVTWALGGVGCSGSSCGTISTSGLYTAPTSEPVSAEITITATSVADSTRSASANISVVPPQAAGYNVAWEDDFSPLSLCTGSEIGCNWYSQGLWWIPPAGSVADPSGSYVNIQWASGQSGSPNSTNISTAAPSGTAYHAWSSGYIEVSAAFDPVTGSFPAVWLLPVEEINANTASDGILYGELDMLEWQSQTPTEGYSTVHVWQNQVDIKNNNSTDAWRAPAGTDFSKFNTYGVLLTPTSISWYFNNVLVNEVNTNDGGPYQAVFSGAERYFLILSQQAGCNWTTPCSGQVSPLNTQVQWVHVFTLP